MNITLYSIFIPDEVLLMVKDNCLCYENNKLIFNNFIYFYHRIKLKCSD